MLNNPMTFTDVIKGFGLILLIIGIPLSIITLFESHDKDPSNCSLIHKWTKWTDPVDNKQTRNCTRCNLYETTN